MTSDELIEELKKYPGYEVSILTYGAVLLPVHSAYIHNDEFVIQPVQNFR